MAVIETRTFRLTDGVDEAEFLEADEQARTGFLYHQAGMLRATSPAGYAGCGAAIAAMDLRPLLPAIKAPTLVISGSLNAGRVGTAAGWDGPGGGGPRAV